MQSLDLTRINAHAKYIVWQTKDEYLFETEHGILYSVSFDEECNFNFPAYWFNLTNLSQKKSPGDAKIEQTVICIIEDFFRQNPDVLLYMCSTANEQQAMRSRLFLRWFHGNEQQQAYYIKTAIVKGEGLSEYVAIILPRSHPQFRIIIQHFNNQVNLFNDNK